MSDVENIYNLFNEPETYDQFIEKNYIKVYPSYVQHGPTKSTKYNCKNEADKLIMYHEAYFELKVKAHYGTLTKAQFEAETTKANGDYGTFKNTTEFIKQGIVRLNNKELDNHSHQNVCMEILNSLEYSDGAAKTELGKYGWLPETEIVDDWNNNGAAMDRSYLYPIQQLEWTKPRVNNENGTENMNITDTFESVICTINIPLKFISTFFRTVNYPIIHNNFEIEVTYDPTSAFLTSEYTFNRDAIKVEIMESVLVLPHVKLNTPDTADFIKTLGNDRTLTWLKPEIQTKTSVLAGHHFNELLTPSLNGVKKLLVVFIPEDFIAAPTHHIRSSTTCTLRNTNIEIDSEHMFKLDLESDIEHYQLTQECMNMQGKDYNTGVLLHYINWLTTHKYYCFNLERQAVLESDPRKSQAIRFKTYVQGDHLGTGKFMAYFILMVEKTTVLNFSNPSITATV